MCNSQNMYFFYKKKPYDFTRKKQQINLNFELALNNSAILLPTKNYVDRPKTKSVRDSEDWLTYARPPAFRQNISRLQLNCNSTNKGTNQESHSLLK